MANETISSYQVKIQVYNYANLHAKAFEIQVAGTPVDTRVSWHPEEG